jgi:hypothetical protein
MPKKKREVTDNNNLDYKAAGDGLLEEWIPRAEFDALLNESALPEKIANLYLKSWRDKVQPSPEEAPERAVRLMMKMQPTADELKAQVGERLYYAAGLLAHVLTVSRNKPARKASVRFLVELFFFRAHPTPMRDGRGAKPKVTTAAVQRTFKALAAGANQKSVAARLGCTAQAVRDWGKSEGFERWKDAEEFLRKAK